MAITRLDRAGRVTDEIEALADSADKALLKKNFDQKTWSAWRQHHFDDRDRHDWTRVYHDIPDSGAGSSGTHYDETRFLYDKLYRREFVTTPGGTVTRTVFDVRGLPTRVQLGQLFPGSWLGKVLTVTEYEYDDGQSGRNGNLTKLTQHVEKSECSGKTVKRITAFKYNWRDQRVRMWRPDEKQDEKLGVEYEHNNLDQVTSVNDVPRKYARLPKYDTRGRVYQIEEWFLAYAPGYTSVSKRKLVTNVWRDPAGNVIAREHNNGLSYEKFQYDALRRATHYYLASNRTFARIADLQQAGSVASDIVFEQTETSYDEADNVVRVTTRRRSPGASTTSPPQRGPLKSESLSPYARVSHFASWHDALGRVVAEADYGANGMAQFTRPAALPSSTDHVLVLKHAYMYNQKRRLEVDEIDPYGRVLRTTHDHAARRMEVVENWTSLSTQPTRYVTFKYTPDGLIETITASNVSSGSTADQVTEYAYGGSMDYAVNPSILLGSVKDPEGRVTSFTYNRQQEVVTMTDANKTKHGYGYDKLGRLVCDSIVFALNVDFGVCEIGYDYDEEGRLQAITSYDAPRRGENVGKTVNRVERYYNQFGMITSEIQVHSNEERSARDRTHVDYGYSVDPHAPRLTTLGYPHGGYYDDRVRYALAYKYQGTTASRALNRVEAICHGDLLDNPSDPVLSSVEAEAGQHLAEYTHWGQGNLYRLVLPETGTAPQASGPLATSVNSVTGGTGYDHLDLFDRVLTVDWENPATSLERTGYAYDRMDQRLARMNWKALETGAEGKFDELYRYDALCRLKHMGRGGVTGLLEGHPTLATRTFTQEWVTLDQQDNWERLDEEAFGDGGYQLGQTRTHDRSNRIQTIHSSMSPEADIATKYDAAGNMTLIPDLPNLGGIVRCEYDAWNRLVRVRHGETKAGEYKETRVGEYEYDGLGRRIVKRVYDEESGALSEARHFYYSQDWRLLEERVEEPGKKPWQGRTDRRYVWGLRGLDDLVFRDRDTNGNGTLDERLYALSDANGNITALYNPTPSPGASPVAERFFYDPYGKPRYLGGDFASQAQSNVAWNILYGGYYYDAETGLYHVRNRMYDPLYGRWLQTDPSGFDDSYNLYQYGLSSPLSYVDPTGEFLITGTLILGGLAIAGTLGYIGYEAARSPDPGAVLGAGAKGLGAGGVNLANEFTLGLTPLDDYRGELYQELGIAGTWADTASGFAATAAREALIAAATLGIGNFISAGVQTTTRGMYALARLSHMGLTTYEYGSSAYDLYSGIQSVRSGNPWGWLQIGLGGVSLGVGARGTWDELVAGSHGFRRLRSREVEIIAENIFERRLRGRWSGFGSLKNASGHGIDLGGLSRRGRPRFVEVKGGGGSVAPGLTPAQQQMSSFVGSRLARAAGGEARWWRAGVSLTTDVQQRAQRLQSLLDPGATPRGLHIEVTNLQGLFYRTRIRRWRG